MLKIFNIINILSDTSLTSFTFTYVFSEFEWVVDKSLTFQIWQQWWNYLSSQEHHQLHWSPQQDYYPHVSLDEEHLNLTTWTLQDLLYQHIHLLTYKLKVTKNPKLIKQLFTQVLQINYDWPITRPSWATWPRYCVLIGHVT